MSGSVGTALLILLMFAASTVAAGRPPVTPLAVYGNGNQHVLADPHRPMVYLADSNGDAVAFLNTTTVGLIANVTVGLGPRSVDLSRDGNSLLVAVSGENKIAIVDIAQRAVSRNLILNFTPMSVRDGRPDRLYASASDKTVRVLNATSGLELARLTNPFYQSILEVSPDGSILLFTAVATSSVVLYKFDIRADTPVYLDSDNHDLGGNFQQEAVDWERGTIYLASGSPYGLEIVSLATMDRLGVLPMEIYPVAVGLAADGSTVYGLNSNNDGATVWAYDSQTGVLQRSLRLPRQADLVVASGDRQSLLVGSPIERIAIEPSLGQWDPSDYYAAYCYSPSRILAQLVRGLPDVRIDAATLWLDGSALPTDVSVRVTPYETYHLLGANVTATLSSGAHTIVADIRWNGKVIQGTWAFTVDYSAGSPTCPDVQAGFPGNGAIVNTVPPVVEASVWGGDPTAPIENATMALQGQPRASVLTADRLSMDVPGNLADGVYEVTAQITWRGGSAVVAWHFTIDTDYSVPQIPLIWHASPAGFSVPIPDGWTVRENVTVGNASVDMVVLGPSFNGIQESVIVDSEYDPATRETNEYLLHAAEAAIREIQVTQPDASMAQAPVFRSVGGHAAVTFVVQYGTRDVIQRAAIVASENHSRDWIIVVTMYVGQFPLWNATFGQILDGFVITLPVRNVPSPPPVEPPPPLSASVAGFLIIFAAGAAVGFTAVAVILLRRWGRDRLTPYAYEGPLSSPCPRCGNLNTPGSPLCTRCGQSLVRPPPGGITPP